MFVSNYFFTIISISWKANKYIFTFGGSIFMIGVFSYFMVWWATTIGHSVGIPDAVMGLTFLAAGTSMKRFFFIFFLQFSIFFVFFLRFGCDFRGNFLPKF